jgi:hypothetical protein
VRDTRLVCLPCPFGERLFHHRRGIDEDFDLRAKPAGNELGEMLELAFDNIMIIAVARIDRNIAPIGKRECGQRIIWRGIAETQRDHAARLRP